MIRDEHEVSASRPLPPELARAIVLEARAHYLRMCMLTDADFIQGIAEGEADIQAGRVISLEQARSELGIDEP